MKNRTYKKSYTKKMKAFKRKLFSYTKKLFKLYKRLTIRKTKKLKKEVLKYYKSYFLKELKRKKQYLSNIHISEPLQRMTSVFLFFSITLMASGIGSSPSIGYTRGYYGDTENSSNNTFSAGQIDFILTPSTFSPTTTSINLSPGDITVKNISVNTQNSNLFTYTASTTNVSGDMDFCSSLNVSTTLEDLELYDALLIDMKTEATTTLDSWNYNIGMGVNNFQNSICNFDTEYLGSQTRHDLPFGTGYNDTETVDNTISSWGFRINKVYYDVVPERGEEGLNEWVEIYNQTNIALDISGWEICDNTSCDTLPFTPLIPAQEYAIIVATSTTVSNTLPAHWYLPNEVTQINIDSLIGNGLSNESDMLILKRPDGVVIDQMNWGEPNAVWANWNEDVWMPGATDVAEGNVLTRVPSGYDTNQSSDFTELIPPSIDLIYPDEAGSYTWYWTYNYTIEWNAINNNGNDGDLDIRLFYVKDVNGDSIVSGGDIMIPIAETTANTGSYDWTVPSGFIGYIWIYILSIGPENPMLNSGAISGSIWDPIPLFIGSSEDTVLAEIDALDTETPSIALNGNNPAVIPLGTSYNDLGAIVTDNVNMNLGFSISGIVDTETLGEYTITYTATDQAGNTTETTRTVIIYDPEVGPPIVETIEPETTIESAPAGSTATYSEPFIETTVEASTTTEPVVATSTEPTVEEPIVTATTTEPVIETPTEISTTTEPIVTTTTEPTIEEPLVATTTESVIATTTEPVVVAPSTEPDLATTTEPVVVPAVEEIIPTTIDPEPIAPTIETPLEDATIPEPFIEKVTTVEPVIIEPTEVEQTPTD